MSDCNKGAPSALGAALGANVAGLEATGRLDRCHSPRSPRKRLIVKAIGPEGQPFKETGQVAKVLLSLVKAGEAGVTPLARETWSLRLSDHVRKLKNRRGLTIVTLWGKYDDGRHARYVLRPAVNMIEFIYD